MTLSARCRHRQHHDDRNNDDVIHAIDASNDVPLSAVSFQSRHQVASLVTIAPQVIASTLPHPYRHCCSVDCRPGGRAPGKESIEQTNDWQVGDSPERTQCAQKSENPENGEYTRAVSGRHRHDDVYKWNDDDATVHDVPSTRQVGMSTTE